LVYDATVIFCDRFIPKTSRTHDQMVQGARSGVQNIVEGSMASGTSSKSELKLTNVARSSLEELMRDYENFIHQRGLRRWDKDAPEALAVRGRYKFIKSDESDRSDKSERLERSDMSEKSDRSERSDKSEKSDIYDPYSIRTADAETAANTLLCLINQASYLLRQQLRTMEEKFLNEGGFTERMYRERKKRRDNEDKQD